MTIFETEPCGRCGGSGTYSYCQRWGTTCFDCGTRPGVPGSGRRLSKRGRAARDFYRASFPTKLVTELAAGDVFRASPSDAWTTVESVGPIREGGRYRTGGEDQPWQQAYCVDVKTTTITWVVSPDARVTLRPNPDTLARLQQAALDYQATLTKQGAPRKRAVRRVTA